MKLKTSAGFVVTFLTICSPAYAHHSFGMFDLQKNTVYEGTILEYNWENPHAHIVIKMPPHPRDSSTAGTWDIEAQAVNIMTRQGWNHSTYKAGDHAVIVAHPMKDGSKGASIFYAIMPDGRRLYGDIARPSQNEPTPDK